VLGQQVGLGYEDKYYLEVCVKNVTAHNKSRACCLLLFGTTRRIGCSVQRNVNDLIWCNKFAIRTMILPAPRWPGVRALAQSGPPFQGGEIFFPVCPP
jgi:hypothetical protein